VNQTVNAGDDLTDAFNTFQAQVNNLSLDNPYRIGFGPHPALQTETLKGATGFPAKGKAVIDFTNNAITATLDDVPATGTFDLYFVKNNEGSGRTARPETGDTFQRVGGFTTSTNPNDPPNRRVLSVSNVSAAIMHFDIDLVVVTRAGQNPAASRIALGARTLFEKRLFRARFGQSAPPVLGDCAPGDQSVRCQLSTQIESLDPLVQRGAQLFFKETFNGNGRTCGTCHRQENNLTIDPAFIATLPSNDPLFVAETNPNLSGLENPALMRQQGLIQENIDGFGNPVVLRGVPHTFAMQTLSGPENALDPFPNAPPDNRLGWSGDGAPGRGTMAEFAFGAVVQHFTNDLRRRPGTDFRIPTQAELDAMEAFQLFTGRQKFVDARPIVFRDSGAQNGSNLFLTVDSGGKCTNCHFDMGQNSANGTVGPNLGNLNAATNVKALTPNLPNDDGFLNARNEPTAVIQPDNFNIPVLIEAADTGPFFHNNAEGTSIEGAISFYVSPQFQASAIGAALGINLTQAQINDVGAFLRGLNAAENIRQIRKRVTFVRDNRSSGNDTILQVAIADSQDALDDLQQRKSGNTSTTTPMNPNAIHDMQTALLTLQTGLANADANRPAFMSNALTWLDLAKQDLFTANPNNDF
jgi:cytochrome c peroxidase